MSIQKSPRIIAIYFTQLHPIPENDRWWGKGFTDWVKVKQSVPLFDGHAQPRVPLNNNYYDQSQLETIRWQIDLAREYGIGGFCHYHYWFDGKQLLETPTNLFLANKDLKMPFCLSWANETWSRRWDGQNHRILIKQTHPPCRERWKLHFDYLIKAWTDERAITVDGRPVFVIYRPHHITDIANMLDFWREEAVKKGLKGLYFIAQRQDQFPNKECLAGFDAVFQFHPFDAINERERRRHAFTLEQRGLRRLAARIPRLLRKSVPMVAAFNAYYKTRERMRKSPRIFDYDETWSEIVKIWENDKPLFPGAFIDWDNSPRFKEKALVFKGASPERFEFWLTKLVASMKERNLPEDFIFVNAWNEWAEGTYLEPDLLHGYGYLEAIKRVLERDAEPR